jgi:hypothetical protein
LVVFGGGSYDQLAAASGRSADTLTFWVLLDERLVAFLAGVFRRAETPARTRSSMA